MSEEMEKTLEELSRDLQESKARLEEAQRIAQVGHYYWNLLENRVIWSDELYRIYGLNPQKGPIDMEVVREMMHPEDREFVFRTAEESLHSEVRPDIEHRIVRPNGEVRIVHARGTVKRDASGQPYEIFGTVQDITERKRAEAALQSLSLIDELTGLYNRRGFLAVTEQHVAAIRRDNKVPLVVYADLDGLKEINDSHGHHEGDRALASAAQILKETFRSSDILARLGGDEFVALAAVDEDEGAEVLTDRLQEQFRASNALRTRPYNLSVSVGVAHFEDDRYTIEELMAQADQAMYEEKRRKPSRYTYRTQFTRPRIEAVA